MTLAEAESSGFIREVARTIANAEQAAGVLTAIGFPRERAPPFANSSTPLDFWRRVCGELANGVVTGGIPALIAVVAGMYPGNSVFNDASRALRGPISEGQASATPGGDACAPRPSELSRAAGAGRMISILLVCANARGDVPLRLGEEERALREALRLATNGRQFSVTGLHAATLDDLRRALLRAAYDIVHFAGHGTGDGLRFEDAIGGIAVPDSAALAELLQRRGVKTVVLNACDSLGVGLAGTARLEHTIAMDGLLSDKSAIEFSRGFYDALGEGLDVAGAFDEGVSCCKLKRLPVKAVLLRRGDPPTG